MVFIESRNNKPFIISFCNNRCQICENSFTCCYPRICPINHCMRSIIVRWLWNINMSSNRRKRDVTRLPCSETANKEERRNDEESEEEGTIDYSKPSPLLSIVTKSTYFMLWNATMQFINCVYYPLSAITSVYN